MRYLYLTSEIIDNKQSFFSKESYLQREDTSYGEKSAKKFMKIQKDFIKCKLIVSKILINVILLYCDKSLIEEQK